MRRFVHLALCTGLFLVATARATALDLASEVRVGLERTTEMRVRISDGRAGTYAVFLAPTEAPRAVAAAPLLSLGPISFTGVVQFLLNPRGGTPAGRIDHSPIRVDHGFDPTASRGAMLHLPSGNLAAGGYRRPDGGDLLAATATVPFARAATFTVAATASVPNAYDETNDEWIVLQRRTQGALSHVAVAAGRAGIHLVTHGFAAVSGGQRVRRGSAFNWLATYDFERVHAEAIVGAAGRRYRNPWGRSLSDLAWAAGSLEIGRPHSALIGWQGEVSIPRTGSPSPKPDWEWAVDSEVRETLSLGVSGGPTGVTVRLAAMPSWKTLSITIGGEFGPQHVDASVRSSLRVGLLELETRGAIDVGGDDSSVTLQARATATLGAFEVAAMVRTDEISLRGEERPELIDQCELHVRHRVRFPQATVQPELPLVPR